MPSINFETLSLRAICTTLTSLLILCTSHLRLLVYTNVIQCITGGLITFRAFMDWFKSDDGDQGMRR